MQNRYNIKSKSGYYCEALHREDLELLRKVNHDFKGCHIKCALQAWDDVVKPGIVYPSHVKSRDSFIAYNRKIFKD